MTCERADRLMHIVSRNETQVKDLLQHLGNCPICNNIQEAMARKGALQKAQHDGLVKA